MAHDPLEGIPHVNQTFLGIEPALADFASARVALLPVPYDSTTSYRAGTREGPSAILSASMQMEEYDTELDREPCDVGIYTAPPLVVHAGSPEAMVERVERAAFALGGDGRIVGVIGGEHGIAVGGARAALKRFPGMSVLYIDAHADMRDAYQETRYSHACAARRISERCPVTLVGIRSATREEMEHIRAANIPIYFCNPSAGPLDVERVVSHLSDDVYISLDLDALDTGVMSAVGNPEPGGLPWNDVLRLARAVGETRRIVGFDVVELSPGEGPLSSTYAAAKLVYKLIGYATQPRR